jgi:ornithine carrier protein
MQVPVPSTSSATNAIRVARPGVLALIASVYRHHGLRGFWHGQLGTLIRETGGSAAWFGTYEGVSLVFRELRPRHGSSATHPSTAQAAPLPIYQQMTAGAFAGMAYNFIFFPADTIKSRMQTEEMGHGASGARKSFAAVGRALWQQQGLRGLYQGCGITVARSAPSSAFIFAIYEGLRGYST